jgi:DNA-binding NtrC family response regulator
MKVMVIDDDTSTLEMFRAYFEEKGIEGILLSNSSEARDQIKKNAPDCILIDLKMGPPTGKDIIEQLHNQRIEIPVIVMSAFITYAIESELKKLGISRFLYKPFELPELDKIIILSKKNRLSS